MIAARAFTGAVGGVEKTFAKGDKITPAEAEEMGLDEKPELVEIEFGTKPKKTR